MKFLLFTALVASISCVNAGKTARLLAAMNAGMLNGMIGGGLNPALLAGGGVGLLGQPQLAQFVPGLPPFALRAPVANVFPAAVNPFQVPVYGVPQMAQMNQQPQMGMAGGAMQQQPLMAMAGAPMQQQPLGMAGGAMQQQPLMAMAGAPMQQQPLGMAGVMAGGAMQPQAQMGMAGGVGQQQLPVQPDPLRRFRRQLMKSAEAVKASVDTQIPTPTESGTTPSPCDNSINY